MSEYSKSDDGHGTSHPLPPESSRYLPTAQRKDASFHQHFVKQQNFLVQLALLNEFQIRNRRQGLRLVESRLTPWKRGEFPRVILQGKWKTFFPYTNRNITFLSLRNQMSIVRNF